MLTFLEGNGYALEMKNDKTLGRLFEACLERKLSEGDLVAMLDRRLMELD